jgi:hypothetical protein
VRIGDGDKISKISLWVNNHPRIGDGDKISKISLWVNNHPKKRKNGFWC